MKINDTENNASTFANQIHNIEKIIYKELNNYTKSNDKSTTNDFISKEITKNQRDKAIENKKAVYLKYRYEKKIVEFIINLLFDTDMHKELQIN